VQPLPEAEVRGHVTAGLLRRGGPDYSFMAKFGPLPDYTTYISRSRLGQHENHSRQTL